MPIQRIKKEESDVDLENTSYPNIANESEAESSEDESPLYNPKGYQEQVARRAARRTGVSRLSCDNNDLKVKVGATVKQENHPENAQSLSGTPHHTAIAIHSNEESEDSDTAPDCSVNDPRYVAWARKRSGRPVKVESQSITSTSVSNGHTAPIHSRQNDAKPYFEMKSEDQRKIGSFDLGYGADGQHVCVPASINRFLRDYQREGVKFFWEHYANGKGGLLGDDMGN